MVVSFTPLLGFAASGLASLWSRISLRVGKMAALISASQILTNEFKPIFLFCLFCFGHWPSNPRSTLIGELGSHVWEGLLFDWLDLGF